MRSDQKFNQKDIISKIDDLTTEYVNSSSFKDRKDLGQFFTPSRIGRLMFKQFDNLFKENTMRILDPGAGIGIFEGVFCELIEEDSSIEKIIFDCYENDSDILPYLKKTIELCKNKINKRNFDMTFNIIEKDFICDNSNFFNNIGRDKNLYDYIITNPPYYKLRQDSKQAKAMKEIVWGQPNIYILFMAMGAKLLKKGGQICILSPRSYCSGEYSKKFRKWFLEKIKPTKLHIFESRKIFKRDNILQEMMIFTGKKEKIEPKSVKISRSFGEFKSKTNIISYDITYENVVRKYNGNIIIRIPASQKENEMLLKLDNLENKLEDLGLKISTGPIVPFRMKDNLIDCLSEIQSKNSLAPLLWMDNLKGGKIHWPIENGKSMGVKINESTKGKLLKNKNYVLVKRFSSKESNRRLYASFLSENHFETQYIALENHINYIYKNDESLSDNVAKGLTLLLNSKIYSDYFQSINGSTQVNISEMKKLSFPPLEEISKLGELWKDEKEERIKENKILNFLGIEY